MGWKRLWGITYVYNRRCWLRDISVYRAVSKDSYDHVSLGDELEFTHDERDITNTELNAIDTREMC